MVSLFDAILSLPDYSPRAVPALLPRLLASLPAPRASEARTRVHRWSPGRQAQAAGARPATRGTWNGGLLKYAAGSIPGRGCADLHYARGAQGALPTRVGGAIRQLIGSWTSL